jgi:predicted secreted hydrolase
MLLLCCQAALTSCGDSPDTSPAQPSALQQALGAGSSQGFARAETPRDFEFPRDHGAHPRFRNEWWYYTGVLRSAAGRQFGFELTFFRVALQAQAPSGNPWRSNQVFFAHFAVTDVGGQRFHAFERVSRPADGLAGARADPFAVWLEDWRVAGRETWQLAAAQDQVSLSLSLAAQMQPVLNGDRGLSRKSAAPGNASYYYSLPRLRAHGALTIDGDRYDVQGLVWMDREWSTSALSDTQVGWDWFALHLDDGSNLMFYRLRDRDGAADRFSAGTWSFADGRVIHLQADALRARPHRFWTAADSGRYPVGWDLHLPEHDLRLDVTALLDDQWLNFMVPYWEGAVSVTGQHAGRALSGHGYLELTGYSTR